jgi:hypothetical protein
MKTMKPTLDIHQLAHLRLPLVPAMAFVLLGGACQSKGAKPADPGIQAHNAKPAALGSTPMVGPFRRPW